MNKKLKRCPFCGSKACDAGGTVQSIAISVVRCSNADCLASFKSVDAEVWNTRSMPALDDPQFWLLVRRFCMAPDGPKRNAAKRDVLTFVAEAA